MTESQATPIEHLVRCWQERFDRGEDPDIASICREHPELVAAVAQRIGVLRRFECLIGPSPAPTDKSLANGQTTGFDCTAACPDDMPIPDGYEVLGKLGQGGMGIVFKARRIALNRVEVLKMIRAGEFASPLELTRFRFEAEAAANLDHPHIVPVFGVGEAGGQPYLAMRWIDGASLADRRPSSPRQTAEVVAKIASAVHHAHQRGILHRDLKPANIIIDAAGEPFVTDFGVARRLGSESHPTQSGGIVGTPQFMAPEQARGDPNLTVGADVYALGGILYFCLTGHAPFRGKSSVDVLNKVITEPPAAPRTFDPKVDVELEAVCLKCLEKDPTHRYPTAAAVAEEMEQYLRGEGVSARAPGLFDWLRQLWRVQPQPSYSWEVLVWFGAIMLITHIAIFGIVASGGLLGWVWLTNFLNWVGIGVVLYWYMARRFRRLPPAERHNMMTALGHALATVALTFAVVPFSFSALASACLPMFPPLLAVAGLGFFVVGSTHWSRFFPFGLGMMTLAPVAAIWLDASPLIYGVATTVTLWFWAYCKKKLFSNRKFAGST